MVGIVSENESGRVGDMASAALNVLETLLEGDGDESSHGIQADVTRSGTVTSTATQRCWARITQKLCAILHGVLELRS